MKKRPNVIISGVGETKGISVQSNMKVVILRPVYLHLLKEKKASRLLLLIIER